MSSVTLYFTPATNARLARIKAHLPDQPLSQLVDQVLVVAERELGARPMARPWETDLPSDKPATRNTVYLRDPTERRVERLRQRFQELDGVAGKAILKSVVVARAIALAETPMMSMTPDEIELDRVRTEAEAIEAELPELVGQAGEHVIERLLELMAAAAALFAPVQRIRQRLGASPGRPSPIWESACAMLVGPLNQLMRKTGEIVIEARRITDRGPS
jgi:hypothetical protein